MQAMVPLDRKSPDAGKTWSSIASGFVFKSTFYLLRRLEQESQKFTVTGRISHL